MMPEPMTAECESCFESCVLRLYAGLNLCHECETYLREDDAAALAAEDQLWRH